MVEPVLEVRAAEVGYGGIVAVKGIDLRVDAGELVCLIGSNGAGKTTTMKAITALLPLRAGEVRYRGRSVAGRGPWDLANEGLVMVPEGRGVFARMSIAENLLMGAYLRDDKTVIANDLDRVFELFPRLAERRAQLAGTLSGGEQQMLAMGRALMARPHLLLLDEPSMGLAPLMVDRIFEVIRQVHEEGITILLVEQNAARALQIADRAYVMESGLIGTSGPARAMLDEEAVRQAYLGG
jgi:branched-chain amino acid transport system ATP-binding protein